MNSEIDFTTGWNTIIASIDSAWPGVLTVLSVVGVLVLLIAIITYFWQKRRGGSASQGTGALVWAIIIGLLFCAPKVLIPLLLTIGEFFAGLIVSVIQAASGGA